MRIPTIFVISAFAGLGQAAHAQPAGTTCHVATYQIDDGNFVDVAPAGSGELRWRSLDGRTGRLARNEAQQWTGFAGWTSDRDETRLSFGPCGSGQITFDGKAGRAVELEMADTQFRSGAETLSGRLVLPKGKAAVPVVVLGHGSERTSALVEAFRQRLYPSAGVGIFVFDKRGTGRSSGNYTQDFEVLATDVAAAMGEARRLAAGRASRFGFLGGSQAGWVLPLAARKAPADFVIVGYGVAASPLVEDRTETMQDLVAAGWGGDVLTKAREITDSTGKLMASRFTNGFGELRAVVARYSSEPWFKDLDGEFTGEIVKALAHPDNAVRAEGQKRDVGTSWNFDAMGSLRQLSTPLLWMVAGSDTGGAGEETRENLLALQRERRAITIAVFPETDHGIHTFRTGSDGRRLEIGYAPDYFRMELDYIRAGKLTRDYPSAQVHNPEG